MRRLVSILICCLLLAPAALADDLFAWTQQIGEGALTTPAAMVISGDGGLIIAGSTTSESNEIGAPLGGTDGFVIRLDAQGNTLWKRRLGGSLEDLFTTVIETMDGGCLAMGTTTSNDGDARASRGGMDAWVVKLNADGETEWTKCLGGSLDDELYFVQQSEDGSYFVCGRTQSRNGDLGANNGGWDAWALMISHEDGKPLWRSYRYGFEGDDKFTNAYATHEGWLLIGEIAEKYSDDPEGNPLYHYRPIAQFLGSDGVELLETPAVLGDTGTNIVHEIIETDNGWILAGETNSRSSLMPTPHGGMDLWILQIRQTGSVPWQRAYGGRQDEWLHSIYTVPTGGFVILAETASSDEQVRGAHGGNDVWVVRITSTGVIEWHQAIGGSDDSLSAGLLMHEDGGYLIAGTTTSQDGDIGRHISVRTGFLARLSENGNLTKTQIVTQNEECTLMQMEAQDGIVYLLGIVRSVNGQGPTESIWVARLAEEGYYRP